MLEHRNGGEIRNVPTERADEYTRWRRLLTSHDLGAEAAIQQAINSYVDNWLDDNGAKEHAAFCSSWIPGSNWEESNGGVYQPIYGAILESFDANPEAESLAFDESRKFFGLIVLEVISHRDDDWICWREPHPRNIEPLGMFYRPKRGQRHEAA
jgi:hypothetical protein